MKLIAAIVLSFFLVPQAGLQLTSSDFANNQAIAAEHSCDGAGTSEALSWTGLPEGTRSLALVLFDPDARPPRGFVHWVAYDIPPTVTGIPSGKYSEAQLPGGGVEGNNGRGTLGFIPSCPPAADAAHHYTFTLYALSVPSLGLAPGATRDEVLAAMKGKTLGEATLVGLYKRAAKALM
jgi:hypothetical protein